jgi:hypothetical protein
MNCQTKIKLQIKDLCLARLSKMVLARYGRNNQDRGLVILNKIDQEILLNLAKPRSWLFLQYLANTILLNRIKRAESK